MKKSGFAEVIDLKDHIEKDPKAAHGIWGKVLRHGPKVHVSNDAPTAGDGVDGDVWLEY